MSAVRDKDRYTKFIELIERFQDKGGATSERLGKFFNVWGRQMCIRNINCLVLCLFIKGLRIPGYVTKTC